MATETPFISDGSQCIAAANYSAGAGLGGRDGSGQFLAVFISASRTVTLRTTLGGNMYGILQNQPALGQPAEVAIIGICKATAGAALNAGDELQVDGSSRVITWTAGGSRTKVGKALEASPAANAVISIALYQPGTRILT